MEPKSNVSANSTMPAYFGFPIFTRRGSRGGAQSLIRISYFYTGEHPRRRFRGIRGARYREKQHPFSGEKNFGEMGSLAPPA